MKLFLRRVKNLILAIIILCALVAGGLAASFALLWILSFLGSLTEKEWCVVVGVAISAITVWNIYEALERIDDERNHL